jgi:carbon starvation protein
MTILPVIAASAVILSVAYFTYGRWLMRWLGIDASRVTPAVEFEDGNDFCPAPAPVVLGGHFTAIAAAGPVVGPILAGIYFGWLPALLWILIGAIFIGGVHDCGALLASIRHKASSITQVVREHMSRRAYVTFLVFVYISLIYVVIAFADVTATSFAKFQKLPMTIDGVQTTFTLNGGAVAIGASAYLLLSILLGLALRYTKLKWWIGVIVACVLLGVTIALAPAMAQWLAAHGLSFLATSDDKTRSDVMTKGWDQALLVYCFIASIVPMWILLQPRGLIGATFLYATLVFGVVGTIVGGLFMNGESLAIQWPVFKGFIVNTGTDAAPVWLFLFPILFITIACGACSGFHSIVASGTTSKQIRKEGDIKPIGYGAMLLEAMVAIFALSCVMVLARPDDVKGIGPDGIYARGIGNFMRLCGIPIEFAIAFGLLAFSSFVFDTMDVCTRLGRYVMQELTGLRGLAGGALATVVTLAIPSLYLWGMPAGSFRTFWTIFGTANQLLAALTLVGVSVWLWRTGRPVWYALLPAIFMLASTGTALVMNFWTFLRAYRIAVGDQIVGNMTNMVIAAVLFLLGLFVVVEAVRVWNKSRMAFRVRI